MPREVPLLRNEVIFVVGAIIFSYCAFLYNPHGTLKVPTQLNRTYDYIVVGAGTAGCVLASRLSEHNSKSVLILESGDEEQKLYYSHIPASAGRLMHSKLAWRQRSVVQKHCCDASVDQQVVYVRGNVLGGGGVLDLMIYDRGHPEDYEQWAAMDNVGWSYEDVARYFMKAESFDIKTLADSDSYGQKGLIHVSEGQPTLIGKAILEAAKSLGYKEPQDPRGSNIVSGFRFPRHMIHNGVRQSTVKTYLRPVLKRKNLHVVAETHVTKIDFDKKHDRDGRLRTTGVTFQWKNGRIYHALAAREVILAAGALSTPYILMQSGLGEKAHLQEQNIEVKEDLPVLGQNLIDHPTTVLFYSVENLDYHNHASHGFFDWLKNLYFYYVHGSGPLTTSPILLSGFFRSGFDPDSERPDLQLLVTADTSIVDPKIIQNLNDEVAEEMEFVGNSRNILAIIVSQLHTKSTGSVKIKHQQQHNEHDHHQKWTSEVDPNFYDDDNDVKVQARGLRIAINIMESEPMKKFNPKLLEKPMTGCKQGLKFMTDQYLECIARKRSFPSRHQSGTCRMGVDAQISVVDPKLRVHGVSGLRIADASVFPSDVSANSNMPTIMMAEKAADLIKETDQ